MMDTAAVLADKDPEFREFLEMMSDTEDGETMNDFARYVSRYPYSPGMFTCDEFLKAWNRYV